jgi:hypothetical protein
MKLKTSVTTAATPIQKKNLESMKFKKISPQLLTQCSQIFFLSLFKFKSTLSLELKTLSATKRQGYKTFFSSSLTMGKNYKER